jgi:hypothetical protein
MTASALATAAPPTTALVSSQFNSMTFCMMTLLRGLTTGWAPRRSSSPNSS